MAKLLKLTCVGARQQVVFLYAFLISGLTNSAILAVEFIVEEQMPLSNRHFHHTRHARASRSAPYKSAASSTTSTQSHEYDSFSLNCPHVADASNSNVRIEVTWTLNDTIWLKIEDGEKRIYNRLTTFNKRIIAGKTVLRVLLNDGRYFFDYDELTGDFAMEIRPVHVEDDAGVWQCHVTVFQKGNTHTLTSRSRVKVPHGKNDQVMGEVKFTLTMTAQFLATFLHDLKQAAQRHGSPKANFRRVLQAKHRAHNNRPLDSTRYSYDYLPPLRQQNPMDLWDAKPNKVTSFTRNDQGVVQISREETNRPKTVVFDRQAALAAQSRHAHASIDYELSMNENGEEPYYLPRSRARSTYYSAASYLSMSLMFVNLLILHMLIR